MARVRISTTVDERLLAAAREARAGVNDSALDVEDEWGDVASFRMAAGSS